MTAAAAETAGFRPLTTPYFVKKEALLLNAVVADLKRGGIPFVLVETSPGRIEIWRRGLISGDAPNEPTRLHYAGKVKVITGLGRKLIPHSEVERVIGEAGLIAGKSVTVEAVR